MGMPKRSSINKGGDINTIAARIVAQSTAEPAPQPAKNPAAVALGRLGGLKGGNARAAALSKAERSAIARKAATQRWGKHPTK
jgi:hypothetical protein